MVSLATRWGRDAPRVKRDVHPSCASIVVHWSLCQPIEIAIIIPKLSLPYVHPSSPYVPVTPYVQLKFLVGNNLSPPSPPPAQYDLPAMVLLPPRRALLTVKMGGTSLDSIEYIPILILNSALPPCDK